MFLGLSATNLLRSGDGLLRLSGVGDLRLRIGLRLRGGGLRLGERRRTGLGLRRRRGDGDRRRTGLRESRRPPLR